MKITPRFTVPAKETFQTPRRLSFIDWFNSNSRHANLALSLDSRSGDTNHYVQVSRRDTDSGVNITLSTKGVAPNWGDYEAILYDTETEEQIARVPLAKDGDQHSRTISFTNEQLKNHSRYAILLVYPETDLSVQK